jgi:hypothetical protein
VCLTGEDPKVVWLIPGRYLILGSDRGGHSPEGALMLKFWINVQIYANFYADILPNFLFSISGVLLAADN